MVHERATLGPVSYTHLIKRVKINYVMPFSLEASDIIGNAKSELLARCSQATLNTTRVSAYSSPPTEPAQTVSVTPNVLTEIKHSEAYYDCRFECDNPSVVIQQETHYAFVSYLKITGVSQDVDVKLYANTYASESTVPYTETLNQIGDPVTAVSYTHLASLSLLITRGVIPLPSGMGI